MTESECYLVPAEFSRKAWLTASQYQTLYQNSINEPDAFWEEQARKFISWDAGWDAVKSGNFGENLRWYINGKLNASYNCLDRHLPLGKAKLALIWEGDDPTEVRRISYGELQALVCQFANVLKDKGIKRGDRVCIYLPMIPEIAIAMLACARIGAIHSVVFSGFSAEALKTRILDAKAKMVITADQGLRGGKIIPLKLNTDKALESCSEVETVLVVKRTGALIAWDEKRDCWYHEEMAMASVDCIPESMDSNDPLFILYTSGSTGKPKGILHATAGYLVYTALTHHYVFNYHPGEIYWCTADAGWITGHSYGIYGPLLNGATTVMYEGIPSWPDFSRFWQIIDRHQVNIFYTAPTAIRALRKEGDDWVKKCKRSSLTLLGTVGEPINSEVWRWYYDVVGDKRCPIVDTWWQTETSGAMITPIPGATALKPGSATRPFLGIEPAIVDENGKEISDAGAGLLVIKKPWPGLMQTIYGDHQRFVENYFTKVPGCYFTGDGARRDADGYYWITGRNDDVIKVSGHRISTAELESAFLKHLAVSEAAVVAIPHSIKGQAIYAFITVKSDQQTSEDLRQRLIQHIRNSIGPLATPDYIQWTPDLPKTRSGKIMRRILRLIATDEMNDSVDISTLTNPAILEILIKEHKALQNQ